MILSSLANRLLTHRKSQTTLPVLSLNELQKNYYLLRQPKENKNPQNSQTRSVSSLENDLLIKSPFYDRSKCTQKHACKCKYHKKIRYEVQKKLRQKDQILKNSISRLKTLADTSLPKSILSQKRFNSLANQTDFTPVKDHKYYQSLISNNHELYQEFLKKLNIEKKSNLDCFNHEFEEFLRSHSKWILHQVKKIGFGKGSSTAPNAGNNRLLTVPSMSRKSQAQAYTFESKDKHLRTNADESKKYSKKILRKNTQYSFAQDDEDKSLKSRPFMSFLEGLKPQERSKLEAFLEAACKQIGINYSQIKNQTVDNANFFTTICKHLLDQDGQIVEKAQAILRRMSRLPFELYSTIMRQMNLELATNFDPKTKTFEPQSDRMEKSVSLAFETIEESLGQMMKNNEEARAKDKLSILSKLKYKFVGRASLNCNSKSDSKSKLWFSNSDSPNQRADSKRSGFASEKRSNLDSSVDSFPNESESEHCNIDSNQNLPENTYRPGVSKGGSKQQRRSLKKGLNLQKMKKNDIMKIIDEEIEFENSKKLNLQQKNNSLTEDEYLRERRQSRKRLRDEELNKHMEFLRIMKQKQAQRVSSTMSECGTKKNTARAHYQRHKLFIKKIEVSLKKNQVLKEMVINYDDDLFTKKRKVRILKNMIVHELPDKQSEFCREIHKYIDIFEKNCQLVIGKNDYNRFKKYAKRKGDSLFENSYLEKDSLEIPTEMGGLIQLLRSDNHLKFYNVSQISFEEEEYFSLIKEIPSFTTQKISNHVSQRQPVFRENALIQIEKRCEDDVLAQIGMQTQKIPMMTVDYDDEESKKEELEDVGIEDESRELKNIRDRFNKNMEKYKKIFKTEGSLNR